LLKNPTTLEKILTDNSSSQDNGALQNELRRWFKKGFNDAGAQNLSSYYWNGFLVSWQAGVQEKKTEKWSEISEKVTNMLSIGLVSAAIKYNKILDLKLKHEHHKPLEDFISKIFCY
jgi:hypothetical protein